MKLRQLHALEQTGLMTCRFSMEGGGITKFLQGMKKDACRDLTILSFFQENDLQPAAFQEQVSAISIVL